MPKLHVGERAPEFSTTIHDGSTIRLTDFLDQRALVLFFYPRDGTPVCTKEACSFGKAYAEFAAAGAEVVGISGDSAKRHQAFAKQHGLPFPLISDADGSLRKRFGLTPAPRLIPRRVTYVIDRKGFVRLAYSALFAADEHVRRALKVLTDDLR
ncbi:MAG: peroxiredoxin [Planctomycetaceae bacterium]